MTALFLSNNPAVPAVNDMLTASGLDLATDLASPGWYANLHRQQAEQVAFSMLPAKHHRDAPRLFAEHLFWLTRAKRWRKDGWPWRYETQEDLARALYAPAVDTIKKASADLKKAGLLETRTAYVSGTTTTATHYRLTDQAHIVLGLLTLAGVEDLTQREWLDLISPTDAKAKTLRDVLAGWQDIDTPAKLDAMRLAIKAAVARVQPEGATTIPRAFYDAFRGAVKAAHPGNDPGTLTVQRRKVTASILKELRLTANEPGAGFTYDGKTVTAFASDMVKRWGELAAKVKASKGKKLPPEPDLDALARCIPLALDLHFNAPALVSAQQGWGEP